MGVTNPDKIISNTPGVAGAGTTLPAWQDDTFFQQTSDRLADKGFVLTTVDDLITWSRTGSLMWMTFGLACCAASVPAPVGCDDRRRHPHQQNGARSSQGL